MQLLAIARGLDPDRWRPICVLPDRGELAGRLEGAGAEVVAHPLAVLRRRLANPSGALGLARGVRRDRAELATLARERGAALVHSNTSVILSGGAVARAAGLPHLVHVREIYPPLRVAWPVMRRRLLRADALACISRAVQLQFGDSERARLVYDGLPQVPDPADRSAARARLGLPADAFVAAFVGRLSDWKGQDVLARALASGPLAEIDAIGLVAGDEVPGSGQRSELDRLAAELGVEERLVRLGFVEDTDAIFGAADALVVPSKRPEPLGLVALEGMAAGLPVVASNEGGVAEVVREAKAGALVAPGDPAALATALRALADNPVTVGGLPERFTAERMLAELQALYDELT